MCFDEEENAHDRKAAAVTYAEGFVVGHLPCEISNVCFHFMKHGGDINGLRLVEDSTQSSMWNAGLTSALLKLEDSTKF